MSLHAIHFRLNGEERAVSVPANQLLIDLLRNDLGLYGTKEGCSVGVCGACSVLIDGRLTSACLVLAVHLDGASIVTVEGLAGGTLTTLQEAFIEQGGFQCGICTPGQIVSATALLAENPQPSPGDVRSWMMGNLCRCTGYYQIVESVLAAAAESQR